ncbi:MAG: glutamine-hydrolyzing carbamoyl-phosphate synthase small subunit [Bdellovibrionota bacterium]|jgi:carbamoyl-phosphate synthase small subunit
MRKAKLGLADGTVFSGYAFGADADIDSPAIGEVVFNTSMYGYQEIVTDASYAGQMVCFTYPHIGNCGCNSQDMESPKVQVRGVIIKNLSVIPSNFRSEESFDAFLNRFGVMGICDVDTRSLVKHIRDYGVQMGAMAAGADIDEERLIQVAKNAKPLEGIKLAAEVSCLEPFGWEESAWSLADNAYKKIPQNKLWARPHLVVIDCGVRRNILRLLLQVGFRVTVVPADYTAEKIMALTPDAVFISNGPGDPTAWGGTIVTVKELIGHLPMFGICLGHQIMALAAGAKTYKLKFGHHGANHPVLNLKSKNVEITAQSHGFSVDPKSLPQGVSVTHINLNDQTIEGLELPDSKAFSIQYYPETAAGARDAEYPFNKFFELVVGYKRDAA